MKRNKQAVKTEASKNHIQQIIELQDRLGEFSSKLHFLFHSTSSADELTQEGLAGFSYFFGGLLDELALVRDMVENVLSHCQTTQNISDTL